LGIQTSLLQIPIFIHWSRQLLDFRVIIQDLILFYIYHPKQWSIEGN